MTEKYRETKFDICLGGMLVDEKVVAVNKNEQGDIVSVKTNQGRVFRTDQAILQVRAGRLAGLQVVNRDGREYIRTNADGIAENNLDNLPEF
jgi:hypothetical protein